jgi:pimeloyl-ACP methyl ester carboxylesterase
MQTIHKEKIELTTSDMWKIALYHYHGHKITRKIPVLLVHGIASDSTIWDLDIPKYSFAPRLGLL